MLHVQLTRVHYCASPKDLDMICQASGRRVYLYTLGRTAGQSYQEPLKLNIKQSLLVILKSCIEKYTWEGRLHWQVDRPSGLSFPAHTVTQHKDNGLQTGHGRVLWLTPQHGNASTWKRTQKWVWVRFLLFSRIIRNPSKTKKCRGISEYFGSVSAYLDLIRFLFFLGLFPLFLGSVSAFQKKF